jgi:hypothetical protein
LLGLQILIGGLLLIIGLYLLGNSFGEFGEVALEAASAYFICGCAVVVLGGCLVGGIASMEFCVIVFD